MSDVAKAAAEMSQNGVVAIGAVMTGAVATVVVTNGVAMIGAERIGVKGTGLRFPAGAETISVAIDMMAAGTNLEAERTGGELPTRASGLCPAAAVCSGGLAVMACLVILS